jgi:hypothetical protein
MHGNARLLTFSETLSINNLALAIISARLNGSGVDEIHAHIRQAIRGLMETTGRPDADSFADYKLPEKSQ